MKNIIVFLTFRPTLELYNLYKKICTDYYYASYICIDDNSYEIPEYDGAINIIKIDNKECEDNGFKDCGILFRHKCYSRDKALYYFHKNNIDYDNIWLIEDDVFIPTTQTIINIDNKYGNGDDLLVTSHDVWGVNDINTWHWPHIKDTIMLPLPWANGMICAIRVSKKLIECIGSYAQKNKTLFMDEALFNTIALHNNLKIKIIPELSTIIYRRDWIIDDINPINLYHPIKNINTQTIFREILEANISDTSNIIAYYGSEDYKINVTNRFIASFKKNNKIIIPNKTLLSTYLGDPIKKIYFGINTSNTNVAVFYGKDDHKIDITNKFIDNFKKNNKIIIPRGIVFNIYFGDPCVNHIKYIYLKINNTEYIINERHTFKDLEFDLNPTDNFTTDNIIICYDTGDSMIDVTDKFVKEFKKNNNFIIPDINHNSYTKNLFLNINNVEYIINQKHLLTTDLQIDINENNIDDICISDMYCDNIIAYYGTNDFKMNITNKFVNKFKKNNEIIIPREESFNMCFGDPCYGHVKKIFLKINGIEHTINENHSSQILDLNM